MSWSTGCLGCASSPPPAGRGCGRRFALAVGGWARACRRLRVLGPVGEGIELPGVARVRVEPALRVGLAEFDELYGAGEREELPDTAVLASLGCGNPTAVAELHQGETVLDLGSGGGIDVLLSARRVGLTGKAYGLEMTDEMLELARTNQAKAAITNVKWLKGHIEDIPLPDASVDVVISNCVINLSADKPKVIAEAARVLKPGGRFAVSDIIADPDMDPATRADMAAYTGCIAGALTPDQFASTLTAAGLADVEILETHRVHPHAGSAIVRARKPAGR
jgi:arsenite methyltransferase